MKKLVLAMACVLSLGLLASCKNGVQDVNLKNQEKTEAYSVKGATTFTAALKTQSGSFPSTTWTASSTTTKSLAGSEVVQFSTVEKTKGSDTVDSNYELYTLTIAYAYNANTSATNPTYTYGTKAIKIYKIGDKWYTEDGNNDANYWSSSATAAERKAVVEFSEGDLSASTFTIKSLGVVNIASDTWELTNVKFTKAE